MAIIAPENVLRREAFRSFRDLAFQIVAVTRAAAARQDRNVRIQQ